MIKVSTSHRRHCVPRFHCLQLTEGGSMYWFNLFPNLGMNVRLNGYLFYLVGHVLMFSSGSHPAENYGIHR